MIQLVFNCQLLNYPSLQNSVAHCSLGLDRKICHLLQLQRHLHHNGRVVSDCDPEQCPEFLFRGCTPRLHKLTLCSAHLDLLASFALCALWSAFSACCHNVCAVYTWDTGPSSAGKSGGYGWDKQLKAREGSWSQYSVTYIEWWKNLWIVQFLEAVKRYNVLRIFEKSL